MRALVGIIVVQCALVAAGLGVLRVLGLVVSRGGRAWLAIGPAFVVGTASVIVLLIALEVIGVPLTFGTAVVVAVLVAAAGFGLTWRRTEAEDAGAAVLGMVTLSRVAIAIAGCYTAIGAVSLGLWIDRREPGHLWLAAILLAAAANTKDEDMVGAVLVLLAAGVALAVRADRDCG